MTLQYTGDVIEGLLTQVEKSENAAKPQVQPMTAVERMEKRSDLRTTLSAQVCGIADWFESTRRTPPSKDQFINQVLLYVENHKKAIAVIDAAAEAERKSKGTEGV